jgi:hypothetical protein
LHADTPFIACILRSPAGDRVRAQVRAYDELHTAIDRLSGDSELAARLDAASKRLQASPGRLHAADLIERIARP